MFCADYVMAFVYHTIFTSGTVYMLGSNSNGKKNREDEDKDKDLIKDGVFSVHETSDQDERGMRVTLLQVAISALGLNSVVPDPLSKYKTREQSPGFNVKQPLLFGVASGLATSITLYPFDFVRGGVLQPGMKRLLSAGSTVPYAGILFGMYFR